MVNYDSVRADQNYKSLNMYKRNILHAQSVNITKIQKLYCTMAVCVWTLAFLKVSIRVYVLCMEHIACHLCHFTPLRNAL